MGRAEFYENLESAVEIARVSKRHKLTLNQAYALAGLYRGDSDYKDLLQKSGLSASRFSRDVIGPLRQKNYATPRRSGKPLSITPEGRNLIEKIGERLEY